MSGFFATPKLRVLASSAVAASHAGNTNETILATITIPAGAMGANGTLRISADWTITSSANNKTLRFRLGGIGGTALTGTAFTTVANAFHRTLVINRNSASSQWSSTDRSRGTDGVSTYETVTAAIDTSVAQTLVITGQLATAGETITLENYLVELITP